MELRLARGVGASRLRTAVRISRGLLVGGCRGRLQRRRRAYPRVPGLSGLIGKSMLIQRETLDGQPRFAMLETILEYAADRLRTDFDADATQQRLAFFLLAYAEEAEPHLTREEQALWLDRCGIEIPNIRRALEWTVEARQPDTGLRIATA